MTNTSAPADDDPRQRQALTRFAAVQAVQQGCEGGLTFTQALHRAAQQPWDGRLYSFSALERWFYRYRDGRFAGLYNQPRRDRGQKRALDPQALEALLQLRRLHPAFTLQSLIQELIRRGVLQSGTFSYSTIHRRLVEFGLDRRSLRAGSGLVSGPTKAFAHPLANLLWMSDCMHGPALKLPTGQSQRTFLFALLDDCSRLCAHAQFYAHERVECFLDSLRQAIQARGLPDKLYTDYVARHIIGILCPATLCGQLKDLPTNAGRNLRGWPHNFQRAFSHFRSSASFRQTERVGQVAGEPATGG